MPFKEKNDNTRVLKPLIVTPIKRKLIRRTRNEEVRQDNRPLIIKLQSQSKSNLAYEQLKWDKAYDLTAQGMSRPLEFINPSHLIGVLTSDKPFIETIGNSDVQATSNEMANFLLSMVTPGSALKAATIPLVMFRKAAFKKLFIGAFKSKADKDFLNKQILTRTGRKMSVYDAYAANDLPDQYQRTFEALIKRFNGELKASEVNQIAKAERNMGKPKFEVEQELTNIRNRYKALIDQVNNESKRGILQLDWMDTNTNNQLGGMPSWLKAEKVGFNKEYNFLERYLSNVVSKVGPKLKELLNKGLLRPTKDGKHWEGLVDGQYIEVDPYRYIISHLDRALAYGNKVNVLPENVAEIPRHGTSGRKGVGFKAKHMTNPSLEYDLTLYSIILDGSKGANDGINYFSRNNGASIPLLRKPSLESGYYKKGRTGSSNTSGVADGAAGERIELPRGVSDPQVGGSAMDEYNFGPGVDNIKSYWNTLDFNYGAGPLAMINKDLDQLLA